MNERIRFPIPQRELDRRWQAIRESMTRKGIDALIAQDGNQWLGGYVRYLTDIPGETQYIKTVYFPANDEMTFISSGGDPLPPGPPDWAVRGVKAKISRPYFRSLNYTDPFDAEEIVKVIRARGDKTVGWIGLGHFSAYFYQYLLDKLPEVTFVDATDMVDEIKAVKSEDELVYVRKCIRIQDIVCAAVPSILIPGKYEYSVRGEIIKILEELGSEEQLIMLGSAPPGQQTGHFDPFYHNRRIDKGDQFFLMVEVNGPGGYYGEFGRTWVLGEPPRLLLEYYRDAFEAQRLAASLIKPGAEPGAILDANNSFMVSKGHQEETRLFAHGQGYDLVERPALRHEETIKLQAGMVLAVHPIVYTQEAYAFACDNFLVTETGCERMHTSPQEVFVIDC
ncbi:MAG: M24 family metallopeptidase [Gracilibacteraceae bacterium]|jgi:Xaa-Pro aminopeptidase|nr:M24 family metallopeptidase [Gracilibacteraceae bacterium]